MPAKRKPKDTPQTLTKTILERIARDPDFKNGLIASPAKTLRDAGFAARIDALESEFANTSASGCDLVCSGTCGYKSCGKNSCMRSCNGNSVNALVLDSALLEFLVATTALDPD